MLSILLVMIRPHAILHIPWLIFTIRVWASISALLPSGAPTSVSHTVVMVVSLWDIFQWQTRSIVVNPGQTLKLFVVLVIVKVAWFD